MGFTIRRRWALAALLAVRIAHAEPSELPLADVFDFFQLPLPPNAESVSLRDWMVDRLARDPVEGEGIDWHGARFEVRKLHDGQILRVGLALASRAKVAPE